MVEREHLWRFNAMFALDRVSECRVRRTYASERPILCPLTVIVRNHPVEGSGERWGKMASTFYRRSKDVGVGDYRTRKMMAAARRQRRRNAPRVVISRPFFMSFESICNLNSIL